MIQHFFYFRMMVFAELNQLQLDNNETYWVIFSLGYLMKLNCGGAV